MEMRGLRLEVEEGKGEWVEDITAYGDGGGEGEM